MNWAKISREADISQHALTREWARELCHGFATWLHRQYPDKPNLVKVFRDHQAFFERVDAQFFSQEDVTAATLLEAFGVSGLRKHLLVSQYLNEAISLSIAPKLKAESAESDRIRHKLLENKKHPWGPILEQYAYWLADAGVPTRTRRLYLSSAEAFCRFVNLSGAPWNEASIQQFLKKKPGVRANLYKFVSHCRQVYGWDVKIPSQVQMKNPVPSVPRTVPQLQKLLHKVFEQGIGNVDAGTLARIIAKSLGFPINVIMSASYGQFSSQSGDVLFETQGEFVKLPAELGDIANAYILRLAANRLK